MFCLPQCPTDLRWARMGGHNSSFAPFFFLPFFAFFLVVLGSPSAAGGGGGGDSPSGGGGGGVAASSALPAAFFSFSAVSLASLSAVSRSLFSLSSRSFRTLASFFTCSSSTVCRSYQACMFLGLIAVLASVMERRPTEARDQVERLGSISLWKASLSCIFLGFCRPMPSKEKVSFVKVTPSLATLSTVTGEGPGG